METEGLEPMNTVKGIDFKTHGESMGNFKILQITDCHLGSECHAELLGLDTDQSLYDVLQVARYDERPDMVLVTGDISNDAGLGSYARFLSIMETYFPNVPLAWLPGNHDDPNNMIAVGKHPIERQHVAGSWNMIFLDSRIPGQEGGRLGERELARLEAELEAQPHLPTAIFLHHQPVPVGSQWLDQYVVLDSDAFFAVVDRFPQVKMISWGHVHQDFRAQRNGVELIATPSTCIQFLPNSDEFKLDQTQPGYRLYNLKENGSFDTRLERVVEANYAVDMTATGY